MSDRKFYEGEVAAQIQLGCNICAMSVDGAVADEKFTADLFACFVVRDKF